MLIGREVDTNTEALQVADGAQITFDLANLGDGQKDVRRAFEWGQASFENPLHTAVASSGGIDKEGRLDMEFAGNVAILAEALRDKQGQPVLIIDYTTEGTSFRHLRGYIAVLGQCENIFEAPENENKAQSGIPVEGIYYSFNALFQPHGIQIHQLRPDSNEKPTGVIPLWSHEFTIGKPISHEHDAEGARNGQEVIVGEDITGWLHETFEHNDAYELYVSIVTSLARNRDDLACLDALLVEPYIDAATEELEALRELARTLATYQTKMINIERMREGALGEANIALMGLNERRPAGRRWPQTRGSYPLAVDSQLDDPTGSQVDARLKALPYLVDPLGKVITRATVIKQQ